MTTVSNALEQRAQNQPPTLAAVVQRMQPELARALPKHMDADRMARLALTVLRQTPALAQTTPESFCGALLTAAALGLEPGVNGEAYLVPYKGECTLIVGYAGYIKLFWQHPLAQHIDAQVVYENDEFDYAYGLEPYLRHKPAKGERGDVACYYAVAALTTGARVFTVLTPKDVRDLRNNSRRSQIADPMHWMARKTAIRQLVKMLPKSTSLTNAMTVDEKSGTELSTHRVPEQIGATSEPVAAIEPPPVIEDGIDQDTGEVLEPELEPEGGWPAVATPGGAA